MVGRQRRFGAGMAVLTLLCVAAQAVLGLPDLALYFTPVLLVVALLLCGRYVGEERILARRLASRPVTARRAPRTVPRPASSRPLTSLLARRPRSERGPPVAFAPAA
jgi:hypothetical protein